MTRNIKNKVILFHDKLLEYGGAEIVLESLVSQLKPEKIVTSCIDRSIPWEKIYKTKIESPGFLSFVNSISKFRIFYPLICFYCTFYQASDTENKIQLIYSSSSAKFFRILNSKSAIFYSNFPAKPLLKFRDYINVKNKVFLELINFICSIFFYMWIKFELKAISKFTNIFTISEVSKESYIKLFGKFCLPNISIVHCPVKESVFNFLRYNNFKKITLDKKPRLFKALIISRLYSEKKLNDVMNFVYNSTKIRLTVIGTGPLLNSYKKKYGKKVIFTGFIEESLKYQLISQSDFVILPTLQEWSMVTVESNVLNTPVISIKSKAIEEINKLLSGYSHYPNLFFRNTYEIHDLLDNIQHSNLFLNNLKLQKKKYFNSKNLISRLIFH
jgi:hypothetical protein